MYFRVSLGACLWLPVWLYYLIIQIKASSNNMLCLKWFREVISWPLPILNTRFKFREKIIQEKFAEFAQVVPWVRCLILWTWIMMIILFQKVPNHRGWQILWHSVYSESIYGRQNICRILWWCQRCSDWHRALKSALCFHESHVFFPLYLPYSS